MDSINVLPTRRDALTATFIGAAVMATGSAASASDSPNPGVDFGHHSKDWAWLVGSWAVRHRKLKRRLAGSQEWEVFDGTCVNWPTLGGLGNVDDNVFRPASGEYRGVGVRAFDARTGDWAIWWLDSRAPSTIDIPVRGGFEDGVGTFLSDDTFEGHAIKVRFMWSRITTRTAHWEQAFSPDGGVTWETNWTMEFFRTRV